MNAVFQLTRNPRLLMPLSWLLALSFAGGSDLLAFEAGGVTWYLFRVVVLVTAGIGLLDALASKTIRRSWPTLLGITWLIWVLWSFLPVYTIADSGSYYRDIFYLLMGGAVWMALHHLIQRGFAKALMNAAMSGLAVNLLLGVLQVITSIQPESAHMHELVNYSAEHFVRFAPVGMFGNPNHFAFYLCLHLLLLVQFIDKRYAALGAVVYALMSVLLFLTASKLAAGVWLMVTLYGIIRNVPTFKGFLSEHRNAVVGGLLLLFSLFAGIEWHHTRNEALEIERQQGLAQMKKTSSSTSRMALAHCAWEVIGDTRGMGLGPGQFESYVKSGQCAQPIGSTVNAHSGIIEITAQYGFVVALVFGLAMLALLYFTYGTNAFGWSVIFLLCFVLLQGINSTFLASPVSWVFMALPLFVLNPTNSAKS